MSNEEPLSIELSPGQIYDIMQDIFLIIKDICNLIEEERISDLDVDKHMGIIKQTVTIPLLEIVRKMCIMMKENHLNDNKDPSNKGVGALIDDVIHEEI